MGFTPQFPWFPNVEIFITRNQLFKHIKKEYSFFNGKLLDVGCGVMPYRDFIKGNTTIEEYVGMDLPNSEVYKGIQPDLLWDGFNIPLQENSVDSVLLTEVLEHCPEPKLVLKDIHRVLKQDGTVIFSVPFIWYLHESPWDFYRYTPFAVKKMFEENGFEFEMLETYGSNDLSFLHSYLIWLKKGALPKFIRFGIYLLSLPHILLFLAFANGKNRSEFKDGQIFIGIVGVAKKGIMSKYQLFTFKRYAEQALMFPFVLMGRLLGLFAANTDVDIFFFIPIYGLGGAEYVNAKILEALPDQKILLVFTKKSHDDTALKLFQHPNVVIKDVSKWTDNKLLYWANFVARGYFAQVIKRNNKNATFFIGQCNFAYKLTPHLPRHIEVLELIHLYDERFCNVWMPFVSFLDKRMCVAQAEIDKILDYSEKTGIPKKYNLRFSELRLFVDIPAEIEPTHQKNEQLKVYYAGRGTAQKRLWLHFEIAKRIKALGLPISFYYVGNFQDELPNDIDNIATFTPSLKMGKEMYEFIKDKNVLLLTSQSEGFPVALLEAMHFGIIPVVTPVGGMPTAIKHLENGGLLDNESEESVINSAIEILQTLSKDVALRHKLSANIKTTFVQDFSKERFNKFIRNYFSLPS